MFDMLTQKLLTWRWAHCNN